jgi:hypothetical protein
MDQRGYAKGRLISELDPTIGQTTGAAKVAQQEAFEVLS